MARLPQRRAPGHLLKKDSGPAASSSWGDRGSGAREASAPGRGDEPAKRPGAVSSCSEDDTSPLASAEFGASVAGGWPSCAGKELAEAPEAGSVALSEGTSTCTGIAGTSVVKLASKAGSTYRGFAFGKPLPYELLVTTLYVRVVERRISTFAWLAFRLPRAFAHGE